MSPLNPLSVSPCVGAAVVVFLVDLSAVEIVQEVLQRAAQVCRYDLRDTSQPLSQPRCGRWGLNLRWLCAPLWGLPQTARAGNRRFGV